MSLPLTVVCGLDRTATSAAARTLLGGRPDAHLVMHCLDHVQLGMVSRTTMNGAGAVDAAIIDLAHGCVSCTLREDVLPTLWHMAASPGVSRTVLVLPEVVEPIRFVEAFLFASDQNGNTAAERCHIEAVVAVTEPAELVPLLSNVEGVNDRGLSLDVDDDRGLGDVLVGQVECADVVLAPAASPQERQLLRLLNPDASLIEAMPDQVPAVFDFTRTAARTSPCVVDHLDLTCESQDAWMLTWSSSRPLHPVRLHAALDDIAEVALRGRGHFQVVTRPGAAVEWDSVGSRLRLGTPEALLRSAGAHMRFVGVSDRTHVIAGALDAAQLTDEELAAPQSAWGSLVDPFADIWQDNDQQEES